MFNRLFNLLAGSNKEKNPAVSSRTDMPLSRESQRQFARSYIEQTASERKGRVPNGVYETSLVSFAFNNERIEGSSLTEWQTRTVFETRDTVLADSTTTGNVRETANHTKMFDFLFDSLDRELTPEFIKEIHLQLMAGVMDVPGQWKILGNGVGSVITARPEEVPSLIDRLVTISYAEAMQVDFVSTIAPMLADRSLSDSLLGKLGIERPNFRDDAGFVGPSTKSLKSSLESVENFGSEIKSDHKTHRTRRI